MGWVVAFMGQKGGTGKSSLACAFASEVSRVNGAVTICDLDEDQRTSKEWADRRAFNKIKPEIKVIVTPRTRVFSVIEDHDIVAIDAPGWSDELTLWISEQSHVVVLPTAATVHDLNPTIRLMQELEGAGVERDKLCCVLYRVKDKGQADKARAYLKEAGFEAIEPTIRDMKSYQEAQDYGLAITETKAKSLTKEAVAVIKAITDQFERIKEREPKARKKALRVVSKTREREAAKGQERE